MQLYLIVTETVLFWHLLLFITPHPFKPQMPHYHYVKILFVCNIFSHNEHWCASRSWCSPTRHTTPINVSVIHHFKNVSVEEAGFIADFELVLLAARVYGVQAGCICPLKVNWKIN